MQAPSNTEEFPPLLSDNDVRQIVRILSDLALKKGSFDDKKRYLLDRLGDLIGADCWVWVPVNLEKTKGKAIAVDFIHDGFSSLQLSSYLQSLEHPDMDMLNARFYKLLGESSMHATRTGQQVDVEDNLSRSPVNDHWKKAGISQVLVSAKPVDNGNISFIAMYRHTDREPFNQREARIAHIILSEVTWLHMSCFPELKNDNMFDFSKLSPRQRTTLTLLLEGLGRKQSQRRLSSMMKEER